jgi:hypothetical protein
MDGPRYSSQNGSNNNSNNALSTKSYTKSSRSTRSVSSMDDIDRRAVALTVLYNMPKPRQEWVNGKFVMHHEKNEEAWVELFTDLVYVVLLSKLGVLLESCEHSVFLYFKVSVFFWIMCLSRQAIDEYANRFYVHDLAHKFLYFVFSCGIFVQIMNINASVHHVSGTDTGVDQGFTEEASHECSYVSLFGSGIAIGVLITRMSLLLSKGWLLFSSVP